MSKKALSIQLILAPTIAMIVGLGFGLSSSIITNNQIRESHISNSMTLAALQASRNLDDTYLVVDAAVEEAQLLARGQFPTKLDAKDDEIYENALGMVSRLYALTAKNTPFICGYWMVFDPDVRGVKPNEQPGDGFFYVRDKGGKAFSKKEVTNLSKYLDDPAANKDHIAWWLAVTGGKNSVWTSPYYNANVDQNMFTFAMPFYSQADEFLGAVGLDLQFDEIVAMVDKQLPQFSENTAKSYIAEVNGKMLWHPNYINEFYDENGHYTGGHRNWSDIDPDFNGTLADGEQHSYTFDGVDRRAAVKELNNGTFYVLTVDYRVLKAPFVWPMWAPVLCYLAAAALIAFGMVFYVRRSLKPLHDLNERVHRVEAGDLSVEIKKKYDDEVGELAESLNKMVESLRTERSALNALAFSDGLTGVKNKAAHREKIGQLDAAILTGSARFAVVMCDVDGLKIINDTQGHINGDKAIRSACVALCNVFKHSPVYRIGGDEFVAIVENEEYDKRQELVETLRSLSGTEATSFFEFSVGLATFQPGIDESFDAVFRRADGIMYQEKRHKKPE